MRNDAKHIEGYAFTAADKLLFDTNIWLHIYGPQGNPADRRAKIYSTALARILAVQCQVYLDVLILSEFVNRYARLRYDILRPTGWPKEFKSFRRSAAFKPIAKDIAADAQRVVKHCERIDSGFETVNMDILLAEYGDGVADFNDQILVDLCKAQALILVTHDADFRNRGLTLLTANQHLLT
jgi:predicted nucleic acid-binding protein